MRMYNHRKAIIKLKEYIFFALDFFICRMDSKPDVVLMTFKVSRKKVDSGVKLQGTLDIKNDKRLSWTLAHTQMHWSIEPGQGLNLRYFYRPFGCTHPWIVPAFWHKNIANDIYAFLSPKNVPGHPVVLLLQTTNMAKSPRSSICSEAWTCHYSLRHSFLRR